MNDKTAIIQRFADVYIMEQCRERICTELMHDKTRELFTRLLNHEWERVFMMPQLRMLTKEEDRKDTVKRLMKERDNEPCYLISCLKAVDGKIMDFADALNCVYGMGCGALLFSIKTAGLFLETEQERDRPKRFIGLKGD